MPYSRDEKVCRLVPTPSRRARTRYGSPRLLITELGILTALKRKLDTQLRYQNRRLRLG